MSASTATLPTQRLRRDRSTDVGATVAQTGGARLAGPYPVAGDFPPIVESDLMPRRVVIALSIGVAVTLGAFVVSGSPPKARPAPPLPSQAISGPQVALASLRGHGFLVNFFASWCVPCRQEAPQLARFAASSAGRGHLVGVDTGDTTANDARRFVARYGWRFSVLNDPDSTTADRYRLTGLPTTYVVDATGRIVNRLLGPQTATSLIAALKAA